MIQQTDNQSNFKVSAIVSTYNSERFIRGCLEDLVQQTLYAKEELAAGHILTPDDYYLAVPLQKGQLSCRELLNDQQLALECAKDAPLMVDMVDSLYNRDENLRKAIYKRGL